MKDNRLLAGLRALPPADRHLLLGFVGLSLLTLGLGTVYGVVTAFGRAGYVALDPLVAYKALTLHGVTIFFYWLYFAQAALVLTLAVVYTDGADGLTWRPAAWAGLGLMAGGLVLSELMPLMGAAVLYDGNPEVVTFAASRAGFFYLGYILLAAGLFLVAVGAIATALRPKLAGHVSSWSTVSYATVALAGLLMVSAIAALNAFLPAAGWAFGFIESLSGYRMGWNVLFHNVHYMPLMATVMVWYVLVEEITGVRSIFGSRFSKIVFTSYLVFVPPTSLYHMFLEPDLAETVKVAGSLLSLFISVPTVLVFLIIVTSLEVHAKAHGGRGLFAWVKLLPWRNPATSAMGMAVINLAIGGTFGFVLIQERLAALLSDTFFVPGYFHFLTLGTVTLSFIAMLLYIIPGLTGHRLWRPTLLAKLPYVATVGLLIFGTAGLAAGYIGVPRRVFNISYDGAAPELWGVLMSFVGIGATLMAAALLVYVYALARTLLTRVESVGAAAEALPGVTWTGAVASRQGAWMGLFSVAVLVGAMYLFTAIGFELMQSLPIAAVGGH